MWDPINEDRPSDEVYHKATKIYEAGHVEHLADVQSYKVVGVTGEYIVVIRDQEYLCSCPATRMCSHVIAARLKREAPID